MKLETNIEIKKNNTMEQNKQLKIVHLEAMRILAILFVVFLHTRKNAYEIFMNSPIGSPRFFIYLFQSIFCFFSVPLFFSVSGAIFLNREPESLKKLWTKRIPRMIIALLIFSVIRYISIYGFSLDSLGNVFSIIYSSKVDNYLWFLYAYIAFLMALPFLQNMVKGLQDKYFYYMIIIAFFLCCIRPIAEYTILKDITLNPIIGEIWLISNIVLYPCIGYFLQKRVKITKEKILYCWIVNICYLIVICLTINFYSINNKQSALNGYEVFGECSALINTITIFITIKYIFENIKMNKWIEKAIITVGSCTFGIYLIHIFFVEHISIGNQIMGTHTILGTWINCVITVAISFIITYILKKIPIIKKLF